MTSWNGDRPCRAREREKWNCSRSAHSLPDPGYTVPPAPHGVAWQRMLSPADVCWGADGDCPRRCHPYTEYLRRNHFQVMQPKCCYFLSSMPAWLSPTPGLSPLACKSGTNYTHILSSPSQAVQHKSTSKCLPLVPTDSFWPRQQAASLSPCARRPSSSLPLECRSSHGFLGTFAQTNSPPPRSLA